MSKTFYVEYKADEDIRDELVVLEISSYLHCFTEMQLHERQRQIHMHFTVHCVVTYICTCSFFTITVQQEVC
jgi:hypothetical protein